MLLVGNGVLITQNPLAPLLINGCVAINQNEIKDFGTTSEMKSAYPDSSFIDASEKIIMPGFINAHHHMYSAFARGMPSIGGKINQNFEEILENLWWKLDNELTLEDVRYSAYVTFMDCIKNGVTTVFDHHASFGAIEDSLATISEVAEEIGIRSSLCYEVSDRFGEDKAKRAIKENIQFINHSGKTEMQTAMFGLHASLTLSDETLEECSKYSGNVAYHVHTAEGRCDLDDCLKNHGMTVVKRLEKFGILGEKSLAIHCIHVTPEDIQVLKSSRTGVVHNPQSNMGNAVGTSPVLEMLKEGVLCGLGTDGYTSDVLESLKYTNLLHKHAQQNPSLAWTEPPSMLFNNNRELVKRQFGINSGIIEQGAKADIIIVDYTPFTPITSENVNSHIHFGFNGSMVETVIINGKPVMKNRKILTVDSKEILSKASKLSAMLWNRF